MKILEVEWEDSCGLSGWKSSDEVIAWMENENTGVCTNVGYLYAESDDHIVLVGGVTGDNLIDIIRIPKGIIISIKEVKNDKKAKRNKTNK